MEQVVAAHRAQLLYDALLFFGFVPKEEHVLLFLFGRRDGRENLFECVGVNATDPGFGAYGHGSRREVLHLLKLKVEIFGLCSKIGHVFGFAAGVRGDEVGDELLAQSGFSVDAVEKFFELIEEIERGFAHEVEHTIACVFGSHFQSSRNVMEDELTGVVHCGLLEGRIFLLVEQEVVAYA